MQLLKPTHAMQAYTTPLQLLPACTVPCWQLGCMDSWGLCHPWTQLLPWSNRNHDSLDHITCCQSSKVQLAMSHSHVRCSAQWHGVSKGTMVAHQLWYSMGTKEYCTVLLDVHLVSPALNVDVIWANVACLLPQAIIARCQLCRCSTVFYVKLIAYTHWELK